MHFDLLHPRDQLVAIMNRIYHNGMTTLTGGNLSILEENGDLWITPSGIDKGNLTPKDIMCVTADGAIVGPHRPSIELPFHRAIYAKRPDLRAVVHAHPPALVSFSIVHQIPNTNIIPQAQRVCGAVGFALYGAPGSEELGRHMADSFAEGYNVVVLENHGAATGGPDLLTAFQRLETLDFCARTELQARRLGDIHTLSEAQLEPFDVQHNLWPEFTPAAYSSHERELRQQIVKTVRRAIDRYLMISTEGVVSARVDENSFLITPTGQDRGSLGVEDIVLIDAGRRQKDKLPSRSIRLHDAIYQTHPQINCVITAQSPNILAYAITHQPFDTRIIPESYLMLRRIPLITYGTHFANPQQVADALSADTPVLLIQNDAVLTVGGSLMQAFDRLEVAEFSAQSLINASALGPLSPITDAAISQLETEFLS
ncbi:MAG: class II aldolase/adducin family protein [Chloroflexi bacterium]|nr:class II aldolase/adducin family protein [Chloroflexota bacterium]